MCRLAGGIKKILAFNRDCGYVALGRELGRSVDPPDRPTEILGGYLWGSAFVWE